MSPPQRGEPISGSSMVLLVEDDPGDAFLVEEILTGQGTEFAVSWVRDLAEAMATLDTGVDCVLLDLGLPDAQGLDSLQTILRLYPAMAVVVLTGFDDRSQGEKALALGAQDYLSKGQVSGDSLVRALRYAMVRRRGEEASRRLREAELSRSENARLERGLLPRPLLMNPNLAWAARYEPGGRRALLGGDFFDAVELEDGTVRFVIGDVSGHGPNEAALGVALRVAWRALVLVGQPPELTLSALQRLLESERPSNEIFASLCDIELNASLDRGRLFLAGHHSPLLFDGTSLTEVVTTYRNPVLGVTDVTTWHPSPLRLAPEWTLVAFTDGIVEGRAGDGNDRLETSGLIRVASRILAAASTLSEVAETLVAEAEAVNGAPLPDDVALVLLSTASRWRA